MIHFLPISILAYALNGGSTIIDKILLNKLLPNPFIYAFYINILGLLAIFLIPFGISLNLYSFIFGILAGFTFVFALLFYFQSLKLGEASVVVPSVGALNPLVALIIGFFLLNQSITSIQLLAFFVVLSGALVLTANIWIKKLRLNQQLTFIILAGAFFGISAVLLRETFLNSNFISGLVISRIAGAATVLLFLFSSKIRSQIVVSSVARKNFLNKTALFMISGQTMGAISGLLIAFAMSLAQPSLVNSLFGVQYLIILLVALFLAKHHKAKLLDENLNKGILPQKILGAGILSLGVYLLSK